MTTLRVSSMIVVGLLVPACSTIAPSHELVTARQAYAEATTPGRPVSPDALIEAQRTLNAAEVEHVRDPQSVREKHLAYIATRDAQIAMARSRIRASEASVEASRQEYLAELESQLRAEREALAKVQRERDVAVASLRKVARVTDKGGTFAISLSGAVLFPMNEAKLLPIARQRLDQVAAALEHVDPGQKVVIEGYTDASGGQAYNKRLSKERAEAVRTYLVSKGTNPDLLISVGKGAAEPVASNESADGRANNRRVEIVIHRSQTARAE